MSIRFGLPDGGALLEACLTDGVRLNGIGCDAGHTLRNARTWLSLAADYDDRLSRAIVMVRKSYGLD